MFEILTFFHIYIYSRNEIYEVNGRCRHDADLFCEWLVSGQLLTICL